MPNYAGHVSQKNIPQTQPLDRPGMVKNNDGGYSFAIDKWQRLERFVILGCEGGHFRVGEQKLTKQNAKCVLECAKENHIQAVNLITLTSNSGRAPKNDSAIFALALIASLGEPDARKNALDHLNMVCRTGGHLIQFVSACDQMRGWGRGLRNGVKRWYTSRDAKSLAFQVTKYAQRDGWEQRDIMRLCKLKGNEWVNLIREYVEKRGDISLPMDILFSDMDRQDPRPLFYAIRRAKVSTQPGEIANLIRQFGLQREHLPTECLDKVEVWAALLDDMPATALIRNLGKMTKIGLLAPLSTGTKRVCDKLRDVDYLRRNRVHPFSLLLALTTYCAGKGVKGTLTWHPDAQVVHALNDAFELSFTTVEPCGKRFYLGLDVSGSMHSSPVAGTFISAAMGTACMAMATVKAEQQVHTKAFTGELFDLPLHKGMSMNEAMAMTQRLPFGYTDCAMPMLNAMKHKIPVDCFVIYTDNDTNGTTMHPCIALEKYRQAMGIGAKLVVVAFSASHASIGDINDAGTLDVVGFDADTPAAISEFVRGGVPVFTGEEEAS